jgi:hypothetical protein
MGPGELDPPEGSSDEPRSASSDTPPSQPEHQRAGDASPRREQAGRAPAETLTREDYGDNALRRGGPIPADSGTEEENPAPAGERTSTSGQRDKPDSGHRTGTRERGGYADDIRAHGPIPDTSADEGGREIAGPQAGRPGMMR